MSPFRGWLAIALFCASGCGDSKSDSDGAKQDAGAAAATDAAIDASVAAAPSLDAMADAEQAAKQVCALAPWVLASVGERQLPKAKIVSNVRDDRATFVQDKPPICVDDKDSGEDLCTELPTEANTYTFLYRGEMGAATDPAQQVWCKSDNYADIGLIAGVGATAKGSCEGLHELIVAWATAQLTAETKRSIRYEAEVLERGSQWVAALVVTSEDGDTLVAKSPELYADTKQVYIEKNGTAALPFLDDDFFGNHYCKLISPAAALAWLTGG